MGQGLMHKLGHGPSRPAHHVQVCLTLCLAPQERGNSQVGGMIGQIISHISRKLHKNLQTIEVYIAQYETKFGAFFTYRNSRVKQVPIKFILYSDERHMFYFVAL